MSVNIPVNQFQIEFSDRVELLLQERGSKLRPFVTVESKSGAKQASPVNQIGKIQGSTPAGRFQPLNRIDAPTDRRWVFPADRELAQLLDKFDMLRYSQDFKGPFAENAALDVGRWMDDLVITAAIGDAKTGELGGSTETFDTANRVAVDHNSSGNVGLTIDKLRETRKILRRNHVNLDIEAPVMVIGVEQENDLLSATEYTSTDYGKPVLDNGRLKSFLGFNFVGIERAAEDGEGGLPLLTANQRRCFAFVKSGVNLTVWQDLMTRVDERKDLSSIPWQIYTCATAGSTRLEQGKVVDVICAEPA